MAAMNFPSSPSNGDTYTNPDTGVTYTYDGTDAKWKTTVTSNAFLPLSGGTLTGALNVTDIKHPSSASNNIVLDSSGGVDMDAFTVSGSAPADSVNLDASGRLLVGTSSALTNVLIKGILGSSTATTPTQQLAAAANTYSPGLSITNYTASGYGGVLSLNSSASNTLGTNTLVGSGTAVGVVSFNGNDGTNFVPCAEISGIVDGTPGANDMPGRLVFSTCPDGSASPVERMRIGNDGTVRLTMEDYGNAVSSSNYGWELNQNGNSPFWVGATNGTGLTTLFVFINDNGLVGTIKTIGSSTQYNTSSDYRLKENIVPLTGAADRLKQLKPSKFNFIADPDTTIDGFIAHEVQAVVPEAISGEKDAVKEDGSIDPQGIDQSKLVPLLTAALQEALAEIESLKARVTALEP